MFDKIKSLIGHAVIYGLGNAGTRVVGFLLIPIYSRYLTPEDYGVLALVSMFAQILYALMNMGQISAFFRTYFWHDAAEARAAVLSTSLWLILTLSFPIGLLSLVLAEPLSTILTGSAAYTVWVVLGIAGVAFKVLLRLPMAVLRARAQSRYYALCVVAQTLVALVLAIIFVVGVHLGGRGILLSQLIAEVLLCAYLLPGALKGIPLTFSKRDAKDLLSYGLALTPAPILSFLLHMSDRYFLKHFVSVAAVGIYALGYRFGEILYLVMMAFELAYPQFVFGHLKQPDAPRLYARVCTYYLAILGLMWLTVSLFAEEIVRIMAAPAYHEAYRVVPWIAGAFLFQGLGYVWSIGLAVHRVVTSRLLMSATTTALCLGLNFWLIPRYEMMGAAVAALITFVFQCTMQVIVGYRRYPIPYEHGRVLRLAVIGAGCYLVGTSIAWGSLTTALLGKSILMLCIPVVLYAAGFFETGELSRIRELAEGFRRGSTALAQARGSGK